MKPSSDKLVNLSKTISQNSSICVKCGLCLEHCPTYLRSHDENESPRGRIALLQALAEEKIQPNPKFQTHIEQCLSCRACERVCPAHVPYGNIIDAGRTLMMAKHQQPKRSFLLRWMYWLINKPSRGKTTVWLIWFFQLLGLRTIVNLLAIPRVLGISHLDRMLGHVQKPQKLQSYYPSKAKRCLGNVGFFVGCLHGWLDTKPLLDAIKLLNLVGFNVLLPSSQGCCGAMHRHDGDLQASLAKAKVLVKQFSEIPLDHIVYLPSGCGAELKLYQKLLGKTALGTSAQAFSHKIIDLFGLLQKYQIFEKAPLPGFAKPTYVFVHTPCTLKHHLREPDLSIAFLKKIKNLSVVTFQTTTCCGAAGNHMLKNPEIANEYLSPYLYELKGQQVHYISSSNIGCELHFKQALSDKGLKVKVVHPVSLLATALAGHAK